MLGEVGNLQIIREPILPAGLAFEGGLVERAVEFGMLPDWMAKCQISPECRRTRYRRAELTFPQSERVVEGAGNPERC